VDEFTEGKVKEISIPADFKRRVYNEDNLIYEIDVYQEPNQE
jgi:hypothetical protein